MADLISELHSALVAAEKDGARLDWFDKHSGDRQFTCYPREVNRHWIVHGQGLGYVGHGPTIREAIDAAMEKHRE